MTIVGTMVYAIAVPGESDTSNGGIGMRRRTIMLTFLAFALIMPAVLTARQGAGPDTDTLIFHGNTPGFREKPKTTMLPDTAKEFANVKAYIAGVVTPLNDNAVKSKFPQVKKTSTDRVAPEKHVVKVHAKLYAVRLEEDNDFHCILGDSETGPYITAEVSGLPKHGDTAGFVSVRKQLRQLIGSAGADEATKKYHRPSPPIPVVVTGSLFYDAEHDPGTVGPINQGAGKPARKAVTQWEIHPVHILLRDTVH